MTGQDAWARFTDAFHARVGAVADETAELIRDSIPAYARVWHQVGAGVRGVVLHTNLQLVALWREGRALAPDEAERMGRIGLPDAATGITLTETMHAYRLSFGVTWRHLTDMQEDFPDLDQRLLMRSAADGFQYLNDLSVALARQGAALEQQRHQHRQDVERALLDAVLASPPRLDSATRLARTLDLVLDDELTVVVGRPELSAPGTASSDGVRWLLVAVVEGLLVAVHAAVPDDAALGRLHVTACGVGRPYRGARGIAAGWAEAVEAFGVAERRGLPVARFERLALDRLLTGSLSVAELAQEVLAPFASLSPGKSDEWQRTLAVYLELDRSLTATARRLHVHPHTARYRVARIEELLDGSLDDHDTRLALQLALRERLQG